MKIQPLEEAEASVWSGGETRELFIYPEGADFKDRDFLFRLSSASFTGTKSTFSDFTGYQRYILPLVGRIGLDHTDPQGRPLYRRDLAPFEVDYFSGAWTTDSENSLDCRDFNLIVREDLAANLAVLDEEATYIPKREGILFVYAPSEVRLLLGDEEEISLSAGQLLLMKEEAGLYRIKILEARGLVPVGEVNGMAVGKEME